MTTRDFVEYLYNNSDERPTRISIETANQDMANFAADGWEMPDGMTAEEYMTEWNALVDEMASIWEKVDYADLRAAGLGKIALAIYGDSDLDIYRNGNGEFRVSLYGDTVVETVTAEELENWLWEIR